jgi:hypothetical protein
MHLVVGLQLGLLLLAELRETQRRFGDRIAMGPLLLTPQSFLKLNFAIMDRLPLLLQPRPLPAEPLPADTNQPAVAVEQAEAAPRGAQSPDMPAAAPTASAIAAAAPQVITATPQVIAAEPQGYAAQEPIAEESLAWSDDGVQFIDGQIPARVIRHWVLERFSGADGVGLVRPREDVFVVPVALR